MDKQMKLSNAINKANNIYVATILGAGITAFVKVHKPEARNLLDYWSNTEDDGNLNWIDDSDLGDSKSLLSEVASLVDGDLVIGNVTKCVKEFRED
jgi:hypothetical protein